MAYKGGSMLPGTLSATQISLPLQTYTPAHTLGSAATSAPSHLTSNALLPFGYWYGHAETKRNPLLMDRLVRNLGVNIWDRWDSDMQGAADDTVSVRFMLTLCRSFLRTHCGHALFLCYELGS